MKVQAVSRFQVEEEEDEEAMRREVAEELAQLLPDQSLKIGSVSRKKRAIHLEAGHEMLFEI